MDAKNEKSVDLQEQTQVRWRNNCVPML